MAVGSLAPATPVERPIHRQPVVIYWFSELYLEELSDVIASSDMDCQTDAFLDKPAIPLFIPAKTGKDVGTQVEEGEVGDATQEGHSCEGRWCLIEGCVAQECTISSATQGLELCSY